jgi:hypothetical protein
VPYASRLGIGPRAETGLGMSQLRRVGRLLAVAAMVTTGLIAVPNALGANQLVAAYAQELVARSTLASAPPALRQSVGAALGPAPATPIAAKVTASFSTSGSRLTTTDGSGRLAVGIGWSEDPELTAADGAAGDGFGYSVAVSGTTAIIGAPDHAGTNLDQGAAYVFTESGGTWSQQSELTAPGTSFGWSVSLSGNSALVGAPHQTARADANEGIAYLYSEPGDSWSPQPRLTVLNDPAGVANDLFGWSVSLSGSTAVVGAPVNTTASNGPGAAYVFTAPEGTWSENATLTAPDGAPDDLFGYSVSTSGATALVGAQRHAVDSHAA